MSRALARNLRASLRVRRAHRIACYLANDGEIDPGPAINLLRGGGRRILLPVLRGERLWFLPFEPGTPLAANRFGIPEPAVSARHRCPARDLDLVLVPLVAFDGAGNRLGMGGGFYDRTFAYLRTRAVWKRPQLIGVAYEFQRLEALPVQTWDIPLQGIATEKRLYNFD
jgi:5-formyltetrahydrofolate cyclo-ligase